MMKWYKNLKIAAKLIIGFFILAVVAGVVGIVGLKSIFEVNDGSVTLYEKYTMGVAYAGEASSDFQRLRYNALKIASVESESEIEYCINNINDLSVKIDELLEKYKSSIINDEDRQIYEQSLQEWKEFMSHINKAIEYNNKGQKDEVVNIVLNECDESGKQLRAIFDSMLDNNILYAEEMMKDPKFSDCHDMCHSVCNSLVNSAWRLYIPYNRNSGKADGKCCRCNCSWKC